MDNQTPNNEVKLVFKQIEDHEEGITFLNIFIEKEGREINAELIAKGEPTLAEQWGHEMLGFIEDFLKRELNHGKMNGLMLTMPKKKDMN